MLPGVARGVLLYRELAVESVDANTVTLPVLTPEPVASEFDSPLVVVVWLVDVPELALDVVWLLDLLFDLLVDEDAVDASDDEEPELALELELEAPDVLEALAVLELEPLELVDDALELELLDDEEEVSPNEVQYDNHCSNSGNDDEFVVVV